MMIKYDTLSPGEDIDGEYAENIDTGMRHQALAFKGVLYEFHQKGHPSNVSFIQFQ